VADQFDVLIIGAGPGGYVAAIRAAQLGLKTAIVEQEHMGGICLNWGCIPTKALLRSAEVYRNIKHSNEFGFEVSGVKPDLSKIVARSRDVSSTLSNGIGFLMKKNKVKVFKGAAKLSKASEVEIEGADGKITKASAKNIILATGARARTFPSLKIDGEVVWTYKHALTPNKLPESLLVVGSGAIGVEFASFFNELGSDVTIVELKDTILPVEDADISIAAKKSFEKQGMTIHTGANVTSLSANGDEAVAKFELSDGSAHEIKYARAIVAVGIVGNIENLGLEEVGVETENGSIKTDEWGQTNIPGVWAIGDVAGAPWLAHKASHEGTIVAERIADFENVHPLNKANIPGCTYSHPQIASVGVTEAQARADGHNIKVGKFPFRGNGKAIALGEPEGFIKTIVCADTAELLGAHMIGAEVTELIQGYVIARDLEATTDELSTTIFPHPTLSEMMHESILDAEGRVIHI